MVTDVWDDFSDSDEVDEDQSKITVSLHSSSCMVSSYVSRPF